MCGIFGIAFQDGNTIPDSHQLKTTADLLDHRGPDSVGIYREAGLGLVHTRLSLVDLNERSAQPFWDSSGRFCLVYNGEIYNFNELRRKLEDRHVVFHTTSDTEVLLQSLIVDGPEATLSKIEGMFAFALFDKNEKTLLLARDRFGIKPLAIYESDNLFLFASEIKAMRPWIKLEPDTFSLCSFLLGPRDPAQKTCFYKGVRILPPGSLLRLRIGEKAKIERYARLGDMIDPNQAEELARMSKVQVVDLVDELLQKSVRQMMFADAQVGALCSGGVDSSLLMAMAARDHKNLAIFHADVKGPGSEYEAALQLSRHLKLDLKKVDIHDQDFIDLLPDVMFHYEHPFFRTLHSVPFLMVSKLVQQHNIKGVLTGEGADECFLGYQKTVRNPLGDRRQKLAALIRRIPAIGVRLAPESDQSGALVTDMLSRFERPLEELELRQAYAKITGGTAGKNIVSLDLLTYTLRTLLHRNDSMGMAAGIEARFPFLSEELVKTAINLPYDTKVRFSPTVWEKAHPFLRDKWVLRKVADRYLPKALSQRKKWPFSVTAFHRMNIPSAYFKNSFVTDYFELAKPEMTHLMENAKQALKIKFLMLDIWGRICIENQARDTVQQKLRAHLSFGAGRREQARIAVPGLSPRYQ
jgi:asparagine synthase (glutamine-hydrolysing)